MVDYRAYGAETGPTDAAADDTAYTMGLEFDVLETCWLKAIHFWQPSGNGPSSSVRKAGLYEVVSSVVGDIVHSFADFPATAANWNTYTLDPVLQLDPGTTFRACVFHPAGRYPATSNYYSSGAGGTPLVVGPLRIVDEDLAVGNKQNSFVGSEIPQFPTEAFNSNKYWIDVTVTDEDPNPTPVGNMSIADQARFNMLAELELSEDVTRLLSNVDLMRLVIAAGGLGLITVGNDTAGNHYERYLKIVRDA